MTQSEETEARPGGADDDPERFDDDSERFDAVTERFDAVTERFDVENAASIGSRSVEIPEAPEVRQFERYTSPGSLEGNLEEVHPDLLRLFVASVLALNLALLAVSLGAMVWYFEGMDRIGGALVLAGLAAGFRTYQYYREYDAREWDGAGEDANEGNDRDEVGGT
ncbi:MAG: hypothetical protein V5A46_05865 [Haloferacaceae archaeon]